MRKELVCWQCGASLKSVPLPLSRLAECPRCRADLHVCRMCKHYDTRLIGECRHDRAERVLDKTHANFCTYFRPRPDAHDPAANAEADAARARLEALFGMVQDAEDPSGENEPASDDQSEQPATVERSQRPKSEAERAREQLEALFADLDKKEDG